MTGLETAAAYTRRLVNQEAKNHGVEGALWKIARSVGVSRWTIWGLYHGRRKSVGVDLILSLRREYLAFCEREIERLRQDVLIEQRVNIGDDLEDIRLEVSALAEEVAQARARLGERVRARNGAAQVTMDT